MILRKVCEALDFLFGTIFIESRTKLDRQNVDIPMGANCAPLVADLFLFSFGNVFTKSLSLKS